MNFLVGRILSDQVYVHEDMDHLHDTLMEIVTNINSALVVRFNENKNVKSKNFFKIYSNRFFDVQGVQIKAPEFEKPKYRLFMLFRTLPIFFLGISDHVHLFGKKSIFSIFPTPISGFL